MPKRKRTAEQKQEQNDVLPQVRSPHFATLGRSPHPAETTLQAARARKSIL